MSGLILVDLGKKVSERILKNTETKHAVTIYIRVDNDTTLRARASPRSVQTYYNSSKQPQEAVTICGIAMSTGTDAGVV